MVTVWASVREVTMIASAIGPHVPNSYAVVTLFDSDGLLLFFMVFHHKGMVRSSYISPCSSSAIGVL